MRSDDWNSGVLITFGFVMGALIGGLICAPLLPPMVGKAWLETYGSGLGAIMTGCAALVVVWQIMVSNRNHREIVGLQISREISLWAASDGVVQGCAKQILIQINEIIDAFDKANPGFPDDGLQISGDCVVEISGKIPAECLIQVKWSIDDVLLSAASGNVRMAAQEMKAAISRFNGEVCQHDSASRKFYPSMTGVRGPDAARFRQSAIWVSIRATLVDVAAIQAHPKMALATHREKVSSIRRLAMS